MTSTWLRTMGVLLGLCACHRRDDLRSLQLMYALTPDTSCEYRISNDALSAGSFDPAVPGVAAYQMALLVKNNLGEAVDLMAGFSGTSSTPDVEYHPVQIQAVETCWYVADANADALWRATDGAALDCASLPDAQRRTVPAGGFLEGGGGLGVVQLSTLSLGQLRGVFGDTFSPTDIPSVGTAAWVVPGDNSAANALRQYSFSPSDADAQSVSRASAWGDKYPASATAQVVVQMRVAARGPGGGLLHSNWLSFPITVCPKCVLASCGTLVQKTCAKGRCGDGTPCLSTGTCADSNFTCSGATLFSGAVPDFGTTGMCMPSQQLPGTTPPSCIKIGCDQ